MALINCNFYSDELNTNTAVNVIIPTPEGKRLPARPLPVLYLLHGWSDDYTAWERNTRIEKYVYERELAVVMAGGGNSFYRNIAGHNYFNFFADELPRFISSMFPISDKREEKYVAGLSMGGYGALLLALTHPERYCAAASLSGALDVVSTVTRHTEDAKEVFGDLDRLKENGADLFYLAQKSEGREKPQLFISCGTEDFLYEDNRRAREVFAEAGYELTYEEHPGSHTWDYWDTHIRRVLDWIGR